MLLLEVNGFGRIRVAFGPATDPEGPAWAYVTGATGWLRVPPGAGFRALADELDGLAGRSRGQRRSSRAWNMGRTPGRTVRGQFRAVSIAVPRFLHALDTLFHCARSRQMFASLAERRRNDPLPDGGLFRVWCAKNNEMVPPARGQLLMGDARMPYVLAAGHPGRFALDIRRLDLVPHVVGSDPLVPVGKVVALEGEAPISSELARPIPRPLSGMVAVRRARRRTIPPEMSQEKAEAALLTVPEVGPAFNASLAQQIRAFGVAAQHLNVGTADTAAAVDAIVRSLHDDER